VAGIEVRDIQRELLNPLTGIQAADYGNAIKYLLRAFRKGRPVQDLGKAVFHINALINNLREGESDGNVNRNR
jgi:hypothetical protein